jgi:hypothetical protein
MMPDKLFFIDAGGHRGMIATVYAKSYREALTAHFNESLKAKNNTLVRIDGATMVVADSVGRERRYKATK